MRGMQGVILLTIVTLLPFCAGVLPVRLMHQKHRSLGMIYVTGWLLLFAVFQFLVIPFIVAKESFTKVVIVYSVVIFPWCLFSVIVGRKAVRDGFLNTFPLQRSKWIPILSWGIFFLLVLIQMKASYEMQYLDGDDAFYVATTVVTDTFDSMYIQNPYYGYSQPLDMRHALSPVPVFIAWIARLTGIQGAVLSHSIMGPVFLFVMYAIYVQLGRVLLEDKRSLVPVFLIFLSVWYLFGNVSLYTVETFSMTRTWQGKSMFGNLVVPAYFIFLLYAAKEEMKAGEWLLLFCLSAVAAFTTSTGIFMVPILMGLAGVFLAAVKKKFVLLFEFAACCIPSMVYGILYLFLK